MTGIFTAVIVLSIMTEVLCDTAEINSTIGDTKYKEYEIPLDILKNIFTKITPGLDYLGELPMYAATSCQQIAGLKPNSTSGLYWIQDGCCPLRVYCNMNTVECGGGVWTRIANINMTIPSTMCPSGLERVTSPKHSCRRGVDRGSSSTTFSNFGLPYTKVCGYVIGYQFATPDAFGPFRQHHTVDNCYADGVLFSYNHPREHIWTFAAMPDRYTENGLHGCPCKSNTTTYDGTVPAFVADDYFCETGLHNEQYSFTYHTQNPLWDGKGFGTFPDGCEGTRNPWFRKEFLYTINSEVELRVCLDESRSNEDILIEQIYIYIH